MSYSSWSPCDDRFHRRSRRQGSWWAMLIGSMPCESTEAVITGITNRMDKLRPLEASDTREL
jgi:hypothetical protein